MTWDEAQKLMDEGRTVYLDGNKHLFHMIKRDGKLVEQLVRVGEDGELTVSWETILDDVVDMAKESDEWEEFTSEPEQND